MLSTVLR